MNPEKPHDKFFRDIFSRLDITADFLRAYLPAFDYVLIDL
jgi:Putative transposase, YhgA-like